MAGTNVNYQLITCASKINPLHMALNDAVDDSVDYSVYNSIDDSTLDSVWRLVNKTIQEYDWK
jgi:hypothetical protein